MRLGIINEFGNYRASVAGWMMAFGSTIATIMKASWGISECLREQQRQAKNVTVNILSLTSIVTCVQGLSLIHI